MDRVIRADREWRFPRGLVHVVPQDCGWHPPATKEEGGRFWSIRRRKANPSSNADENFPGDTKVQVLTAQEARLNGYPARTMPDLL